MTVVVATTNFELYHDIVNELRDRGIPFTTVEPGDDLPATAEVLVRGANDPSWAPSDVDVVVADPGDPRAAVEDVIVHQREETTRRIVGVDPGPRPGIAVLAGERVVATFQVPLDEAEAVVRREVEDATDSLVRIGDGARIEGARLVDALADLPVELVDETGTTPHLGAGARGMADALAAVNIALREGERVNSLSVDPTPGELQVIKDRSRERSPENRAIDATLARRVATGELSLDEALEEHRKR